MAPQAQYDTHLDPEPTVAQVCNRHHLLHAPAWSHRHATETRRRLDATVLPRWGDHRVALLDEVDVSRWLNDMDVAPATRATFLMALRAPIRWAYDAGYVPVNPIASVRVGKADHEVASIPNGKAIRRTITSTSDHQWRTLVTVAAVAGLRRGEICGLQWNDLGLESETPHINVRRSISGTKKNSHVGPPKTQRSKRRMAIGPKLTACLLEWKEARRQACEEANIPWSSRDYVFSPDPDGIHPYPPDTITQWWNRNRRDDSIRFHDLRHFAASVMLGAGHDPFTVATRLGHDPAVLLRTYAHIIPSRDTQAASTMDAALL
jgi:integrase